MNFRLLSGVALVALMSSSAYAQETSSQAIPPSPSSAQSQVPASVPAVPTAESAAASGGTANAAHDATGLGDIVVTAQRISQNSQKAAVAISVISGGDIAKAGVSTVSALTQLAPALTVDSAGTYNFFFIRGVGSFATTSYADPAIAFNLDGVYIGRPTSTAGVFYDLDRVEVLKGPQGTLYGRNATGGAINVLPTQPKFGKWSGYASGSYGNYNSYDAQGAINAPIGDNTAVRIAANVVGHDPYLHGGYDNQKTQAVRAQIKSELTPTLTLRLSGDYAHIGGAGTGYSYVENFVYNPALTNLPLGQRFDVHPSGLGLSNGAFSPSAQAYRETVRAGPAGRNFDALTSIPFQRNESYGTNAEINWQTPIGTLTVIPSYRRVHLDDLGGIGFYVRQVETDRQDSVEARLGKTGVGIFDYNVGVYYYDESIKSRNTIDQSALLNYQQFTTGTKSYAGFGRLTAHLGDKLRLVGGIRYTHDEKRFDGQATSLTLICTAAACPTTPLFQAYDGLGQIPFAIPAQGVPAGRGPGAGTIITRSDLAVLQTEKYNKPTYRGAIEFDVTPRSLLYASVETGYRSGGFNLNAGYETYQPETITAYTIGSKNRFFDNRVQINVEGFYWRYHNQQLPHLGIDLAGVQGYFTQNVANATIKGAEVEGRFLATKTTLLSADVQYLDTNYKNFVYQTPTRVGPPYTSCAVSQSATATLYNVDCSGKPAFNSPKWTVNLSAQQTFNMGNRKIVLGADTQYRSGRFIGFEYAAYEHVGPTWRSNATLSYGDIDDRWSVSAFVRNIEGDRDPTFAANNPIGNIAVVIPSEPRTYGVNVAVKF